MTENEQKIGKLAVCNGDEEDGNIESADKNKSPPPKKWSRLARDTGSNKALCVNFFGSLTSWKNLLRSKR